MTSRKELSRIASAIEATTNGPSPRNTAHDSPADQKVPLLGQIILFFGTTANTEFKAVRLRRSFPIVAFVGPNGGGKTLALIVSSGPTRDGIRWECDNPSHAHTAAGVTSGWRRMLSTVPILDGAGNLHPLYDAFEDFQQLVDVEHSDVYMDEVTSVASSRESQRMDPRVLNKLVQLRKADVVLFWTAPNWARADKVMREVTQVVVECRGYFPVREEPAAAASTVWRSKRVFKFSTFDAMEFEEWSAAKRDAVKPMNVQWFKGVGSDAFNAYDTLGSVSIVASITPEDTCTVCDGRITRHICKGHGDRGRRSHGAPAPVQAPAAPFSDQTTTEEPARETTRTGSENKDDALATSE